MPTTITIAARYTKDADTCFREALSFDQLRHDMRGLIDYRGMPRGVLHEGQSYSYTPVICKLFHLPEVQMVCTRVDPVARVVVQRETAPGDTTITTAITPDTNGSLWTDTIEMRGTPPGKLARWMTRQIHRAAHRRRGAHAITICFSDR